MSKTHMQMTVGFTALDSDHLPQKDGEQMYADDVAEEINSVVTAALDEWYRRRGHELLACEPMVG